MSERIVILGKGGIGKSTIAANLSELYALAGKRVLHIGCDPKSDSALLLTGGVGIPTVVESLREGAPVFDKLLFRTGRGIDCLEAGGPAPGEGCAGMGLLKTFELFEANKAKVDAGYDVVLFDVLGDIVCGGFAVPLRKGFGRKVIIVVSDDLMSLYAANNIARAMEVYSYSGARLLGLVANGVEAGGGTMADRFAELINVKTIARCPDDPCVREAEGRGETVVRSRPGSPFAKAIRWIKKALDEDAGAAGFPKPVDGRTLLPILSGRPRPAAGAAGPAAKPSVPACGPGAGAPPPIIASSPARRRARPDSGGAWRAFFSPEVFSNTGVVRYLGRQVSLAHEDRECAYNPERMEENEKLSFHRRPASILSGSGPQGEEDSSRISTNLGTAEVIRGSGNKIAELAGASGVAGAPDYLYMTCSCVPYAMGEDVSRLALAAQKAGGVPVVVSSTCMSACSAPGDLLSFFRTFARGSGKPVKRSAPGEVLLLGYGGMWLAELEETLSLAGVKACWMLPEYDARSLEVLRAAKRAVLNDSFIYDQLGSVLQGHYGKELRRPSSPYGFASTAAWVRIAASLGGREEAAGKVLRAAAAGRAGAWKRLRSRSAGRKTLFVAGAGDLERIFLPSRSAGIPLAGFLKESGFGIELLVFDREKKSLDRFKGALNAGSVKVDFFGTEKELRRKLSDSPASCVWSDFLCDYRISDAGKAQISMEMFRPGFAGACRTLETILSVCEAGFSGYGRKTT